MTVRIYRSTDYNAPTLSGTVGELVDVLDACLVDGYGSQTITLTRSGTTVTATTTSAHGLVKLAKYTVSGANESDYNGEFSITVTGASEFTYEIVGTPASPATGTITGSIAGSGWTKAYSGTDKAAYLQGSGGNGHYLRIDDTGTTSSRCVGYEAMSDIDTGTGDFPTAAQVSGGLYIVKSSVASTLERDWVVIATEKAFYYLNNAAGSTANSVCTFFGSIVSYKSGDNFGTQIISNTSATYTTSIFRSLVANLASSTSGHYIARDYTGTGTSLKNGKHSDAVKGSTSSIGGGLLTYPSLVDSKLYYEKIYLHEAAMVRGELPGALCPLHSKPLTHLDYFSDASNNVYLVYDTYGTSQCFFEISDTYYFDRSGSITATIKVDGVEKPFARCALYSHITNLLVEVKRADKNGDATFDQLDKSDKYYIVATDSGSYNALIYDKLTPV